MKKEAEKKEIPEIPITPLEERISQSESQYVRDMVFMHSMDEWRAREGKGGLVGF